MLDLDLPKAAKRYVEIDGIVSHPELLRLLDYWQAIGGDKRWPSRDDFDPIEIPFLLGNLHLVDVYRDPLRFRYRLVGTHLAWDAGYDRTGDGPESIPDPMIRNRAIETFSRVASTGRPRASQFERVIEGVTVQCDCLTLPLSTGQRTVDMLLIGQFHRS